MTQPTSMPASDACPRCGAGLSAPERLQGLCARCLLVAGLGAHAEDEARDDDAPRRPAPAIEALAPHFPDLEVVELLGQGGMGAVYRVRQTKLDRVAALKVLALDGEATPAFAERFEREARALASIAHENIVAVHDCGRAGPFWYLLMEHVDGVSLRQMIRAREVDARTALGIVAQICDALQHAHDHGIVHRDVKPENVLVDKRGKVKVLDFGLAKLLGREPRTGALTETGQVMGTPRYMAPEQWERPLAVDHRADIYAVGVVFYELLTGELPIGAFALPSQKGAPDARVDPVVMKTLAKEPERRYQHASEVRTDVQRIQSTPPGAAMAGATKAPVADEIYIRRDHLKRVLWIAFPILGCLTIALVPIVAISLLLTWADSKEKPRTDPPAAQGDTRTASSASVEGTNALADDGPTIEHDEARTREWTDDEWRERAAALDALWRTYLVLETQRTHVQVLESGSVRVHVDALGDDAAFLRDFAVLAFGAPSVSIDPKDSERYLVSTAAAEVRSTAQGVTVTFDRSAGRKAAEILRAVDDARREELVQWAFDRTREWRVADNRDVTLDVELRPEPHARMTSDGVETPLTRAQLASPKYRRFLELAQKTLGK